MSPVTRRVGIRILVSAALLAALLSVVDRSALLGRLRALSWPRLAALLLVNTVIYSLFAWRWQMFARALTLPLSFREALRGIYLQQATAQVMPSLIGDAARFVVFPPDVPKASVLQSIVLDRVANLVSSLALVTLLVPVYLRADLHPGLGPALLLPALGLAAFAWWWRRRPVGGRLEFLRLLAPGRAWKPLALGGVLLLMLGLQYFLAASSLPPPHHAGPALILWVPLLLLGTSLLPISFADWGTREIIGLLVLHPLGLPAEDVVAMSFVVGMVNFCCSLPGALLWWRRPQRGPEADSSSGVLNSVSKRP